MGEFDWLALTSANAAWAVSRRLAELGLPLTILHGLRLAAVGPATAAAARDALGLEADIIPDEFSSAALAQVLTPLAEARVLLPLSSLAETTLADALRAQGASVTCVVAYQTVIGSGGVDLPLLLRRGGDRRDHADQLLGGDEPETACAGRGRGRDARCDRFPSAASARGRRRQRARRACASWRFPRSIRLPGWSRLWTAILRARRRRRTTGGRTMTTTQRSVPSRRQATPAPGAVSRRAPTPPASLAGDTAAGARDDAERCGFHLSALRALWQGRAPSHRLDAGAVPVVGGPPARRDRPDRRAGDSGGDALRRARDEGRDRQRQLRSRGRRAAGDPRDQGRRAGDGRHLRYVLLRVHRSRPLRDHQHARRAALYAAPAGGVRA